MKFEGIIVDGKVYEPRDASAATSCQKCAFYNNEATFGERCKLAECAQCPINLDQYFIEKGETNE